MGKTLAGPLVQDAGAGGYFEGIVDSATGTVYAKRARNLVTSANGDTAAQECVLYDGSGNVLFAKTPADGRTTPTDAIDVIASLQGYNGTTEDRLRVDANKNLLVNATPNVSIVPTAVAVSTTAVALPSSALANRRSITISNNGTAPIYVGGSGVTASTGTPVPANGSISLPAGPAVAVFAISTASQDVRVLEVS